MKRSLALIIILGGATSALAHFKLGTPTSMTVQDTLGGPQKSAPCGLSDTPGVMDESTKTNMVTTVQTGSMLSISINETIFHPGHYRVAIAQTMAQLPADPPVTAVTGDPCDSTTIMQTPTLPVLGDGLLVHTTALSGTQTMTVQLPAGMTCTNCVLQVIQFMSNHGLNNPGGCFYHHCATVTIADNAPDGPPVVEGDGAPTDAGPSGGPDPAGCCSTQRDPMTSLVGTGLIAFLLLRKRRARSRSPRRDHGRART